MTEIPSAEETLPGDEAEKAPDSAAEKLVSLYPGLALNEEEGNSITGKHLTHSIVFAGAENSGKTTILVTIYEALLKAPFAAFRFAGSLSLIGFEQICHRNRIRSGGAKPDTERTSVSETGIFYHLILEDSLERRKIKRHVLFSAVSGERFRMARDSSEDSLALRFVSRADVLVILMDGEKIAKIETRENAFAAAAEILDCFIDDGLLGKHTRVEMVISKFDRIKEAGSSAEEFFKNLKERLVKRFQDRLSQFPVSYLAARPAVPDRNSLEEFSKSFRRWLLPETGCESSFKFGDYLRAQETTREFSNFGRRYELVRKVII